MARICNPEVMEIQDGAGLSPWQPEDEPRPEATQSARRRTGLLFVRYGVPAVIFIAGIVILVAYKDRSSALEAGFMFFGVAIAVLLLNVFFRIGMQGDRERDVEEEARRYFDEHGHWPDQAARR